MTRRTFLSVTCAALFLSGPSLSYAAAIEGTIALSDGSALPPGTVHVVVEGPTARGPEDAPLTELRVPSAGSSKKLRFSLGAEPTPPPGSRIVARLERADGWLLARGTATIEGDGPVSVVLFEAMY